MSNLVLAADSQRIAGFSLELSGRPHESFLMLKESLAFSQQIENLWGEAECFRMLARVYLELGDYGQAIRMGRQGVEQVQRVGTLFMKVSAQLVWGTIQRMLMAWDAATEILLFVLAESREKDITIFINWGLSELCAVYAAAGDWEQAYPYARESMKAHEQDSLLPLTLHGWYQTEALLRGGDEELSRAEVERMANLVGENRRYRLSLLRSRAVLAQWDGDVVQAIGYLQAALTLAQEIGLPGEAWPILGELGKLYAELGEDEQARETYQEAAVLIHQLAQTIDDEGLREGFLVADPTRSILKKSKKG